MEPCYQTLFIPHFIMNPKTSLLSTLSALLIGGSLCAQADWQLIDNFEDGQFQTTWTTTGQAVLDPAYGYLSVKNSPTDNSSTTSSARTGLPKAYSEGDVFTISFDLYLPAGNAILEHQFGFGVGSQAQAELGGWEASGARNRFQTIGPAPQRLGNAGDWDSEGNPVPEALEGTESGVVYNIWLVYDLRPESKGVTIHSKKSTDAMEDGLYSVFYAYEETANDDWSTMEYFCIGQGWMTVDPDGDGPLGRRDTQGALIDSIYLSDGENLTLNPEAYESEWTVVDTFSGGTTEATWTIDDGASLTVVDDAALITSTVGNGGAFTNLPAPIGRGSTTVALQVLLPSGGTNNLNWAQFAVVGEAELAASAAARFGNNDRLVTYGGSSPQTLTKWAAWTTTPDLLDGTQLDTWYQLWLVYDNDARTLAFYGTELPESGAAVVPAEPAAVFDLQTAYAEFSHLILGAALANYGGLKVDNIHQSFGTNLSTPAASGQPGLAVGEWNFTDIGWVYGYTPEWGYSLFMDFVYMGESPWIYAINSGWTYLAGSFELAGGGLGFYMYNEADGWIYSQDNYGGFYWVIGTSDPEVWKNFLTP